jgi:hypothetical protein
MPRLAIGKAYVSTSRLAGGQRRINLFSERNQPSAPTEETLYPVPGLTPKGTPPQQGPGRGLYTASNGDLYATIGRTVYYIDSAFSFHALGQFAANRTNPVYMADNGKTVLGVDGSASGIQINISTATPGATPSRTLTPIVDPNFLGADRISFQDFFLVMNQPGTPNWYSTNATTTVFNPLSFGSLTRWAGNCVALIHSQSAIWLFGQQKGEIWSNAGTFPFPFSPLSGIILEQGLAGPYALGRLNTVIYWLSQAPEGGRIALMGAGRSGVRISNHAVEAEWLSYPTVADCVIQAYQIRGHEFVLFHFPSADRTWVYEPEEQQTPGGWHEEANYDINGIQHRTPDMMMSYAYNLNLSLDWANGQLYARDQDNFSWNGTAQQYLVDFPHILDDDLERITIWRVIGDMINEDAPGQSVPTILSPWSAGFNAGFGPRQSVNPPLMTLQISRDRGKTFYSHSDQLLSGQYGYNTKPTFNRCGVAYDAVLRFLWSGPFKSAMNPPFVVLEDHPGDT